MSLGWAGDSRPEDETTVVAEDAALLCAIKPRQRCSARSLSAEADAIHASGSPQGGCRWAEEQAGWEEAVKAAEIKTNACHSAPSQHCAIANEPTIIERGRRGDSRRQGVAAAAAMTP